MAKKSQKKTPKKHDDEAEDKKLIQKMIDKSCVKKGKLSAAYWADKVKW